MPVIKDREPAIIENVKGGQGRMHRDSLLVDDQLGGVCTYVAHNTVEPHASLGIHKHEGDSELYFITAGSGLYVEDGVEYTVEKGDVLYCPDGSSHGISNPNDEALSFVAVIQKSK